jgi:hypothetical protein
MVRYFKDGTIFDRLDFHDFNNIKTFWVGDLGVKI